MGRYPIMPIQFNTLEDYWSWIREKEQAKWDLVTGKSKDFSSDYALLPKSILDDPRFFDVQVGDLTAELDVLTGAYEAYHPIEEGDVVLDIGAHIGHFTKYALERKASVLAIESHPRNAKIFKRDYGTHPRVQFFQAAAWHTSTGTGEQKELVFHASQSSVEGSVIQTEVGFYDIAVFALAIDDIGLVKLDFVKMDIEGAEVEALKGMEKTIRRCKPFMVIETHNNTKPTGPAVKEFLDSVGYEIKAGHYDSTKPLMTTMEEVLALPVGLWHCVPGNPK